MTRWWFGLMLLVAAFAAGGVDGEASCAAPPSPADRFGAAGLVFVGTVVYTSDSDRVARVRVESIWTGPELPAYVDVHGSPVSGPGAASSVDRHYRAGIRYLFVLSNANQPLVDNTCSATQVYTAEVAAFAPAGARSPAPATTVDVFQTAIGQYWLQALGALVVVAVAAVIGLRLSGRTR